MGRFLYCLITDRCLYRQPLHEIAQLAEESGVDYFQLREKDLTPAELLEIARHIRPFLVETKFVINGHLEVAVAARADGVHLQKENIPISAVRMHFPNLLIGYSAHSKEQMKAAEESGADYVFISPIYPPRSKVIGMPPLGCARVAAWIGNMKIPVFGLGGIAAANLPELREAGCAGAAAISLFLDEGKFTASRMVIH